MKIAAVIFFVACTALVSAQIPFRCKSPDAWEAKVYETEGRSAFTRSGKFFYDAPGQRVSFFEEIYEGDEQTASYDEYFFFKERRSYRYNTMTKQCTCRIMNDTFYPIEVPASATFVDTFIIGTNAIESLGLAVNVWSDTYGPNGRAIIEFVADDGDGDEDCLPVATTEFGGSPGSPGFRHRSFYNIVLGVNPSHFIPPQECPPSC